MENGAIEINGLKVQSKVGVTEAERACPQDISFDIRMVPEQSMFGLGDCIENTIDYFNVSESVKKLSMGGEWKLIETLAEEVLDNLFASYPLREVRVSVRKYVLIDTDDVSVSLSRTI